MPCRRRSLTSAADGACAPGHAADADQLDAASEIMGLAPSERALKQRELLGDSAGEGPVPASAQMAMS